MAYLLMQWISHVSVTSAGCHSTAMMSRVVLIAYKTISPPQPTSTTLRFQILFSIPKVNKQWLTMIHLPKTLMVFNPPKNLCWGRWSNAGLLRALSAFERMDIHRRCFLGGPITNHHMGLSEHKGYPQNPTYITIWCWENDDNSLEFGLPVVSDKPIFWFCLIQSWNHDTTCWHLCFYDVIAIYSLTFKRQWTGFCLVDLGRMTRLGSLRLLLFTTLHRSFAFSKGLKLSQSGWTWNSAISV